MTAVRAVVFRLPGLTHPRIGQGSQGGGGSLRGAVGGSGGDGGDDLRLVHRAITKHSKPPFTVSHGGSLAVSGRHECQFEVSAAGRPAPPAAVTRSLSSYKTMRCRPVCPKGLRPHTHAWFGSQRSSP